MDRLEETESAGRKTRRRQHAKRSGDHRGLIGKNVSEKIPCDDHVEALWILNEQHRAAVDELMYEFNIREVRRNLIDDFNPELRNVEDIRFVNMGDMVSPQSGLFKGNSGDPRDLIFVIDHRVRRASVSLLACPPAWFAEIDPPCKLPDDEQVDARNDLRPQRGRVDKCRKYGCGAKVRKKSKCLPNPEQSLFGACIHRQLVPFRSAYSAEQYRTARPTKFDDFVAQWRSMSINRATADQFFNELELDSNGPTGRLEHASRLLGHFRTDPVARQ